MNNFSTSNDNELFAAIADSNEAAFRELFTRYTPKLFPFIMDMVKTEAIAREIVQEVFLRIWLKKETLLEIEKPSSWLYRVASNLSVSHFRRRQLETKVLENMKIHSNEQPEDGEASLTTKELQSLIHQASSGLSAQRRRIFQMSRELGLSRKEIAVQLGISENTVKNQLSTALRQVQDHIRKSIGIFIPAFIIMQVLSSY